MDNNKTKSGQFKYSYLSGDAKSGSVDMGLLQMTIDCTLAAVREWMESDSMFIIDKQGNRLEDAIITTKHPEDPTQSVFCIALVKHLNRIGLPVIARRSQEDLSKIVIVIDESKLRSDYVRK